MTDETRRPSDGGSEGRQRSKRAGGITPESNVEVWTSPKSERRPLVDVEVEVWRDPRYLDSWCAQRDRVQRGHAGDRSTSRSNHNGTYQPGALGLRCWVPPFGRAAELGLLDIDPVIPAQAWEVVA